MSNTSVLKRIVERTNEQRLNAVKGITEEKAAIMRKSKQVQSNIDNLVKALAGGNSSKAIMTKLQELENEQVILEKTISGLNAQTSRRL